MKDLNTNFNKRLLWLLCIYIHIHCIQTVATTTSVAICFTPIERFTTYERRFVILLTITV